ncbi:MAG: 16S rRNA (guanine(966)-N(2))-methyltransferase RsmD [Lysobacterales bacterium]
MPRSKNPAVPARSAPGRIRIIGGRLRGSKIDVAQSPGLRPTSDRLRETLFNWLQPWIDGARCLDLFAGSGALGIEAWSRGAAAVVLVERDSALASGIDDNLQRLHMPGTVKCMSATDFLGQPAEAFDIVFVDPPFALSCWSEVAQRLEQGDWLADSALIYLESPRDTVIDVAANWRLLRETAAGSVRALLYQRQARLR